MTPQPPDRLLRLREVLAMVGFSQRSVYQKVAEKTFPAPVRIGSASRWSQSEVSLWVEERKAERSVPAERR
jgi:prophage regulatory protein